MQHCMLDMAEQIANAPADSKDATSAVSASSAAMLTERQHTVAQLSACLKVPDMISKLGRHSHKLRYRAEMPACSHSAHRAYLCDCVASWDSLRAGHGCSLHTACSTTRS